MIARVRPPLSLLSYSLTHTIKGPNPLEYLKMYPEDEYMEEMGDNARVWQVYLDEADRDDTELVDGWVGTLDTLLIFVRTLFRFLTRCYISDHILL
jgi:hypothetical protein